jgi:CheY-like chemotaxis protein
MVERGLITRVMTNLAYNAVKHNGPGVRVVLRAGIDGDSREVRFSCSDDGRGIAADRLERLFEPYETGDHRSEESTGLGLAFAKSAVEAHGGRIWCESRPGEGANFYFTLPQERSANVTQEQESAKHVLVVDDEPDFAALMESILRGQGYSVGVATDGHEALDLVRSRRPDAITLDIQMPKKSGLMFYRQIKSDEGLRDIPVIVVTGLPNEDPEWDGFIHSFLEVDHLPPPESYVKKPVDRGRMAELLEEVFAGRGQPA